VYVNLKNVPRMVLTSHAIVWWLHSTFCTPKWPILCRVGR